MMMTFKDLIGPLRARSSKLNWQNRAGIYI